VSTEMTKTFEALRRAADECEQQAKRTVDWTAKATLLDRTAELHWLAKELAELGGAHEELDLV
jgi:hypothetical protein